jgi:hypothetical protein
MTTVTREAIRCKQIRLIVILPQQRLMTTIADILPPLKFNQLPFIQGKAIATVDGNSRLVPRIYPGEDRKMEFGVQHQKNHLPLNNRDIDILCTLLLLLRRIFHLLLVIRTLRWHIEGCTPAVRVSFGYIAGELILQS